MSTLNVPLHNQTYVSLSQVGCVRRGCLRRNVPFSQNGALHYRSLLKKYGKLGTLNVLSAAAVDKQRLIIYF